MFFKYDNTLITLKSDSVQNQLLNNLFEKWKKKHPQKNHFISDGILDEEAYQKERFPILFLAKEPNDSSLTSWDLRLIWQSQLKHRFYRRIAEWSFGIQQDFPPFEEIYLNTPRMEDAMRKISIIEINKFGGTSTSNHANLQSIINTDFDLLHEQIQIICPKIIISGLVNRKLLSILFPGLVFYKSGYCRCLAVWKDYLIVDFYHPSFQTVPAASYSLLQNIVRSDIYLKTMRNLHGII